MNSESIKGWVARDENGQLYLHYTKPERIGSKVTSYAWRDPHHLMKPIKRLPDNMFAELTFDDGPIKVKIEITPIELENKQ